MRTLPLLALLISAPAFAGNWNVPIVARDLANPVPINDQTTAEAAALFTKHCVSCHGEDGSGKGTEDSVEYSLQSILSIPSQPGNVPLSDGELYWKITHGIGEMPSYAGRLTDYERWLTVNHIRLLPPEN